MKNLKIAVIFLLFSMPVMVAASSHGITQPVRDAKKPTGAMSELPPPDFSIGETTINLHLNGSVSDMLRNRIAIRYDNFLTGEDLVIRSQPNDEDVMVFEFRQYGSAIIKMFLPTVILDIVTAPGETVDIQLEPDTFFGNTKYDPDKPGIKFSGRFAGLNEELASHARFMDDYRIALGNNIQSLTPDQYFKILETEKGRISELIDKNETFSGAMKEVLHVKLLTDYIVNIGSAEHYFEDQGYEDAFRQPAVVGMLSVEDLNKTTNYYNGFYGILLNQITTAMSEDEDFYRIGGNEPGFVRYARLLNPIIQRADSGKNLTPKQESALDEAIYPIYRTAYNRINTETRQALEAAMNSTNYTIRVTPEAADDQVLEAIIAQYSGSPLFIDFWATWCGPCINAMKLIKPFKPEMRDNEVVTIYITGSSSPENKWLYMLPDIGGIHYYLTTEQWNAVMNKYDIPGIPAYMIADKEGNIVFKHIGFPGIDALREEFEKVW